MAIIQGGYVRRIKQEDHLKACIRVIIKKKKTRIFFALCRVLKFKALCLLIPSFVIIALSYNQIYFYVGLFLYSYSTAIITSCLNALVSKYGLQ